MNRLFILEGYKYRKVIRISSSNLAHTSIKIEQINVQREVFQLCSGREQIKQYINIIYNWGMDWLISAMTSEYHWKRIESWVGTTQLVFCSGYNSSTLFRNLQEILNAQRTLHSPNTYCKLTTTIKKASLSATSGRFA